MDKMWTWTWMSTWMSTWILALAAMAFSPALAQEPVTEFPAGSAPLSTDALTAAVSDKVFGAQPAKGAAWRLQYNANGYFFANVGNLSDNGKWHVKDSALCGAGRHIGAFCNEFRIKDGTLYMKRQSGEVLKLDPR